MSAANRKNLRRREFLKLAGAAGVGAGVGAAVLRGRSARAAEGAKPNIVLFISDDHTATDCGAYGAPVVKTPSIDRLATQSMTFASAFAGSPTCVPSRNVMYTGLMPFRNGAHANHSATKPGTRSLPHYLGEIGYTVALAGKVHVKPKSAFPFEYVAGSAVREPGFTAGLHRDLHTPAVDDWLAGVDRAKPFCLMVCSFSPHVVWPKESAYDPDEVDVPPVHVDTPETRKARARYYADVTKMDTKLGEVMASVERHGFAGNTVLVYTSDQGAQWPCAKWNLYDRGIRVPLLVRWPGKVEADSTTGALVSLCDIVPTLVDAAGGGVPRDLDGRSFLPVLRGERAGHRDRVFASHTGDGAMNRTPMRCVRTRRHKYILNLAPEIRYTTHIDKATNHDGGREYWPSWEENAKTDDNAAALVRRYRVRPREELYDIVADPEEMRNIARDPEHADVLAGLRSRVAEWRERQGDRKTGPEPLRTKRRRRK